MVPVNPQLPPQPQAAPHVFWDNPVVNCVKAPFLCVGRFFQMVGLDNIIGFTATVITYMAFGWEIAALTFVAFAAYKANQASPPRQAPPPVIQHQPAGVPVVAPPPPRVLPQRVSGTINQSGAGPNAQLAGVTIAGRALYEIFHNLETLDQNRIVDSILQDGAGRYAVVANHRRIALGQPITLNDIRLSNAFNGEVEFANASRGFDLPQVDAQGSYRRLIGDACNRIQSGQMTGFILQKGQQVIALAIHQIDNLTWRFYTFIPQGIRNGPAFIQTSHTLADAVNFLAVTEPYQVGGNNHWEITDVKRSLPQCPLTLDEVLPQDQIRLNNTVFDIRALTRSFLTSYWHHVPDPTHPQGQRWQLHLRNPMNNQPLTEAELRQLLPRIGQYFFLSYQNLIDVFSPRILPGERRPMFAQQGIPARRLFELYPRDGQIHRLNHLQLAIPRLPLANDQQKLDYLVNCLTNSYMYDYVTQLQGTLQIEPQVHRRFLEMIRGSRHVAAMQ